MTVYELIEKLSKYDGKLPVYADDMPVVGARFNGQGDYFSIRTARLPVVDPPVMLGGFRGTTTAP